ncbi:prolyl oligopeptidase family protein [Enhygromyxa salina]|uniref:Prolyl oligopeptidase family protein n=2 Tax=Enhygromyxa salina TaxID=215803 RepID=A0A0C2D4X4_9BACT|nr:prolyl oligopeptidase family protein [Enhygromyxa salina]
MWHPLVPALLLACTPQPQTPVQTNPNPATATPPAPIPASPEAEQDTELGILPPIAPSAEHPFSVLDMLDVDRVSSPALAPDGKRVAYVLRETDMEANKGRTSLWIAGVDGSEPRQLDRHPKGISQPQWAPDGQHIYFMSSRAGTSQVFRVNVEAGEVEQITHFPVAVANLVLSRDASKLAVSAELYPDCPDLACNVAREASETTSAATGVGYDRMFVRHWDTWKDHRRSQLLVADAVPGTDQATIVTKGLDADVPSKPFGGAEEYVFTPDGRGVVFTARASGGGPAEPWSTNFDLFWAPVDASKPPVKLTSNPAWDTHPRFSPDGKQLAYVAMQRPGFEADRFRLMTVAWTGEGFEGEPRAVTQAWDRSVGSFEYAADGGRVFAAVEDLGRKPLFAIDLESGQATIVAGLDHGTVSEVAVGTEQLVITHHDLRNPAELYVVPIPKNGGENGDEAVTRLSHHNDELMARTKVGEPEQFEFVGHGGDTVYGWLVRPVNFDPSTTYPLAFLIHGGPQGSFGDKFHFRWNAQTYAGAGYATVMIDFHGSTGYGQAFTDSISGDWGGKPLEDLKLGLAHVLKANPWIDGDRACALGASYGGFMVNWIAGNWPDRFRCLVNHDGIFDQRMMYYATEELWFPEWEHGGPEYEQPAAYARFNPANHVSSWQTPMLVVHGSLDYRVPLEQGLATFTALQRRGIESRFLHFPDENHWVLSPANSLQWHDEVLRWLDAHTAPTP